MSAVIGIDLGTTNSVVAVMEDGAPVVIANAEGNRTTPSVVHYGGPGEIVVGDLAKRLLIPEPERTIKSIKRFMGLRFSETEERRRTINYHLRGTQSDDIRVVMGDIEVTPEIISSEILKKMRDTAEAYLGVHVQHAVVTVPAYFNDTQRQATKLAGELAGLDVLRIINEPTAASLAYGLNLKKPQKLVVFDLGGGTFDVSMLEIDNGVFEVKSTCGDNTLGGDTFDALFAEHLTREIIDDCGLDVSKDVKARQRVMEAAEKIKCELSTLPETTISLPFIGMKDGQPVHYSREILRLELERVIQPALDRIAHPCSQALEDSGWQVSEIDKVLLVGGSTRMPVIQRIAQEVFERKPSMDVNPDEAVAMGAAIQGSVIIGGLAEVLLLDVTPLSLGVASQGGVFNVLIPRNSTIPTEARKAFTTTRDYQRRVRVGVYQGERKMVKENRLLSEFSLENITPAPKGLPHIDVAFRIDANGILNVSASDISTGASQEVRVDSFMAGKDEAKRLIEEAENAMEKDHAFVQRAALNARATRLQEAVQGLLDEKSMTIPHEEIQRMKTLLVAMDVAFYTGDTQRLQESMMELNELAEKQGDDFLMVKTKLGMA